jgi:hypothetical protein
MVSKILTIYVQLLLIDSSKLKPSFIYVQHLSKLRGVLVYEERAENVVTSVVQFLGFRTTLWFWLLVFLCGQFQFQLLIFQKLK